jgi:hypothetical protein
VVTSGLPGRELCAVFSSRFMPCTQCGESVDRFAAVAHHCNLERSVDHKISALHEEIAMFESQLQEFLATPRGSFESWLAARRVRGQFGA